MNKKILISLAILVFFSLGSSVIADTLPLTNLWFLGYALQSGGALNDDAEAIEFITSYSIATLGWYDLGKWDGGDGEGWSAVFTTGEQTEAVFAWNGSGIVQYIILKADGFYALFELNIDLIPTWSQIVSSDPSDWQSWDGNTNTFTAVNPALLEGGDPGLHAISHTTGYGTRNVPEPATLVLLGIGLLAVPVTRKFTG